MDDPLPPSTLRGTFNIAPQLMMMLELDASCVEE